jgi:hypothetical protein
MINLYLAIYLIYVLNKLKFIIIILIITIKFKDFMIILSFFDIIKSSFFEKYEKLKVIF